MKNRIYSQSNSENFGGSLYQVSLLQSLSNGDYNGNVTINELKKHGNTGIGTFDRLNGELIMLDSDVYRAAGNGKIEVVCDNETTPFAVTAYINDANILEIENIADFAHLEIILNQKIKETGSNHFYILRIDGIFNTMNVRSVPAQSKPYRKLVDVLENEQTFFYYKNIEGSVIGLYCPPYMSQLNAAGWHIHFIDKNKSRGGHVLGLSISKAKLYLKQLNSLQLILPQDKMFHEMDLTLDQSADIEKIEKN